MENQKQDKRYNVTGVMAKKEITPTANGANMIKAELVRDGKKNVRLFAFDNKDGFQQLSAFNDGDNVSVYGIFDPREVIGEDGTKRTFNRFRVFSASTPKTREEIAALRAAKAEREAVAA